MAFGEQLVGDLHSAVESLRITMLSAAFFGAVLRQAQPLTLAPFLQGGFAMEVMGCRQHDCTGVVPVGGEPAEDRFQAAAGAVESSDQCLGGIGANRRLGCGITLGFRTQDQTGLDFNLVPQFRQPAIAHQLRTQA